MEGRYLLVAHSRGGMIACLYASLHPEEVAGLVLADAGSVFLEEALGRRRWGKFVRGARQLGRPKILEAADYEGSVAEIRAAPAVPAIPAVVLTSDHPFDFGAGGRRTWPAWLSAQGRLAAALGARHVTRTNSGHHIAGERLGLVVAAVRSVIRSLNRAAATLDARTRGV